MRENFLNIVASIVRQMSEDGRFGHKPKNILEGLFAEGYDPVDIEEALNWFESLGSDTVELGCTELWDGFCGVRVQGPSEKELLSEGAFAYLARLNQLGIVDDRIREAVLDKVSELGLAGLGVEHLRALVGLVLYSQDSMAPEDVFYLLGDSYPGGQMDN